MDIHAYKQYSTCTSRSHGRSTANTSLKLLAFVNSQIAYNKSFDGIRMCIIENENNLPGGHHDNYNYHQAAGDSPKHWSSGQTSSHIVPFVLEVKLPKHQLLTQRQIGELDSQNAC